MKKFTKKQVLALALQASELAFFHTLSDHSVNLAVKEGLTPFDLLVFLSSFKQIADQETINNISIVTWGVEVAKEKGLLKMNEAGELVYDPSASDEKVRMEIAEEVTRRAEAQHALNLAARKEDNENDKESSLEEGQSTGEQQLAGGEQKEAGDKAGDVQVSAPLAA